MANGGLSVDEVRLAPNGAIYVAPVGSTGPTDVTSSLNSSWTHLGYADEDGVSLTPTVDLNEIPAWQSAVPVKRGLNSVGLEVSFNILQTNKESTALFFAGATWSNGPSGIATLTIPSNPSIASLESAMVVEWTDDEGDIQRLYIARGIVGDRQPIQLTRADAVKYGVSYMALDNNGTMAVLLSNSLELYSS